MRATTLTRPSPSRAPLAALFAAAALITLTAQDPVPAATPQPWCTRVPIAFHPVCRVLEVRTPRGTLRLAVANNEPARQHGLMNVPFVPAGQGMIFVFPDGDLERGFWMKDTITPLDMVFVQTDGTISAVAVNVPATAPKTREDRIARRNGVGRYVIELGAGQAGQYGMLPGSRVAIPPVAAQ